MLPFSWIFTKIVVSLIAKTFLFRYSGVKDRMNEIPLRGWIFRVESMHGILSLAIAVQNNNNAVRIHNKAGKYHLSNRFASNRCLSCGITFTE